MKTPSATSTTAKTSEKPWSIRPTQRQREVITTAVATTGEERSDIIRGAISRGLRWNLDPNLPQLLRTTKKLLRRVSIVAAECRRSVQEFRLQAHGMLTASNLSKTDCDQIKHVIDRSWEIYQQLFNQMAAIKVAQDMLGLVESFKPEDCFELRQQIETLAEMVDDSVTPGRKARLQKLAHFLERLGGV
jgi:hypothetical protein